MKFIFQIHKLQNKPKKVLILDRDGVVIKDTGYPHRIEELIFEEQNIERINLIIKNKKFDLCGFATNQSGVGRKFFSETQFWKCHRFIIKYCLSKGLKIHFTAVNFFVNQSYYRKPNAGMINQIKNFYSINHENVLFIGDKNSDKLAAIKANIKYISIQNFKKNEFKK
tara:strand:- start:315 stop:818 length:504 start_codon:yes stop_codon:yes gene_type:complete